ncbi:hypothetical protein DSO57_1029788 [Entomophthora muscae]|uniref:Uncharacterized protein n=1 Tax=Entomophthora muscae TaxID=34485 RepID=A0ACC2TNJ1_9FUNG|nr:hypothetical protein DSO57_1029788 [Entomophthora muscae]
MGSRALGPLIRTVFIFFCIFIPLLRGDEGSHGLSQERESSFTYFSLGRDIFPWVCVLVGVGHITHGSKCLSSPNVAHIGLVNASLRGHPSDSLDGILVEPSPRMGAKLSYFIPPLSQCSINY